jgi:hypothetical protein
VLRASERREALSDRSFVWIRLPFALPGEEERKKEEEVFRASVTEPIKDAHAPPEAGGIIYDKGALRDWLRAFQGRAVIGRREEDSKVGRASGEVRFFRFSRKTACLPNMQLCEGPKKRLSTVKRSFLS